jgi:hypothetical protein
MILPPICALASKTCTSKPNRLSSIALASAPIPDPIIPTFICKGQNSAKKVRKPQCRRAFWLALSTKWPFFQHFCTFFDLKPLPALIFGYICFDN